MRPRPIVHTYKKVLNFLAAGFAAGFRAENIVLGKDGQTLEQVSNTDPDVPTGAVLKFIEVHFCIANLTANAAFVTCSLQYKNAGQTFVDPTAVGGSNVRNQVMHLDLFSIGSGQNSTHKFKFKIPPRFQRIRETMDWSIVWQNTETVTRNMMVIYKFQT